MQVEYRLGMDKNVQFEYVMLIWQQHYRQKPVSSWRYRGLESMHRAIQRVPLHHPCYSLQISWTSAKRPIFERADFYTKHFFIQQGVFNNPHLCLCTAWQPQSKLSHVLAQICLKVSIKYGSKESPLYSYNYVQPCLHCAWDRRTSIFTD